MPTYLEITDDNDPNNNWSESRMIHCVVLFLGYLIHYIFLALAYFLPKGKFFFHFKKDQAQLIMKKFYLFGSASLFSINYIQGGTGSAVFAVLSLLDLCALHFTMTSVIQSSKLKNVLWALYYFFIMIWFFITIGELYATNNQSQIKDIMNREGINAQGINT